MSKPKRAKPKAKRPRRVVLGVGHPWFLFDGYGTRAMVRLCYSDQHAIDNGVTLDIQDLGAYNRIRLVAEVLK